MITVARSQTNTFATARLKLTFWYILISLILLLIFSIAAIGAERRAFSKIQSALSDKVQRPTLTKVLELRITAFENDFLQRLLFFDLILLLGASAASYFLSGRTLEPIQQMLKQQEEFAADASHELRTPLTTISLEMETLKRKEARFSEKNLQTFNSITEEIMRMRAIVDGLLTLVRVNNIDEKKSWSVFNFTEIVNETFLFLEPLAKEKRLSYKIDAVKDLFVRGSKEQIKQVIIILLDNAIKYTPDKGEVSVSLSEAHNLVSLSVSDSGPGIAEQDLKHIFDRFYRAADSNTQKGSGLGLTIAKKIVENHDGKISVESKLNKGSTFTIMLPNHS